MSHPMHHQLAKSRIDALVHRAEMERMARECRRRGTRRPDTAEPDRER